MENKLHITYSGDEGVFGILKNDIIQSLPSESIEWRRSYGRAAKSVCIEATFVPFREEELPSATDRNLLGQAFFHTFWIEIADIDVYKGTAKDEISSWLNRLKAKNIQDWMIVLVERNENKKGSKTSKLLPRTSVLDKIRNDFCSKQRNRCLAYQKDSQGTDSWDTLLHRIRQLLLCAYNRSLGHFEENMRYQRERRNDAGWSYCDYFLLQEELAYVYEMLGMYDEALVQYDELDALFTQFVLNSSSGETPHWLTAFSKPCTCWEGLTLSRQVAEQKRTLIQKGDASLLDLRNYLFSRQCALLLLLFHPWEMAQRTLPFMHSCINELNILEVSIPKGAVACWVFLSCLEILQTCERFNDSNQGNAYSLYTANLWAYARSKMQFLGNLCGLMPDMHATSEQLHHVVELVSGMGVDQDLDDGNNPLAKLKEALSSKEAFQKRYLEMSELAVGTFKHIKKIRSARLIGCDLAEFYMKLGDPHKAAVFLLDALKTFQEEHWSLLIAQTQLQVTACYEAMKDRNKFIKMAVLVASNSVLPELERIKYFSQLEIQMHELEDLNEKLTIVAGDVFRVTSLEILATSLPMLTVDCNVKLKVVVDSFLPKRITCDTVIAAVRQLNGDVENLPVDYPCRPVLNFSDDNCCAKHPVLELHAYYSHQEDKSLTAAGVTCPNTHDALRRQDSHNMLSQENENVREEFTMSFSASDYVVLPGTNELMLTCKADSHGYFTVQQLLLRCGPLEFLLPKFHPTLNYEIVKELPQISITPSLGGNLIAGIQQELFLTINSGSEVLSEDKCLRLQMSSGLMIQELTTKMGESKQMLPEISCQLPKMAPFQTVKITLLVLVELVPQTDANAIRTKITVHCPWSTVPEEISFHFLPPFMSLHRLHTTNNRKFIQVSMHGLNEARFQLSDHNLTVLNNKDVVMIPLNLPNEHLFIAQDQTIWYMWEVISNLFDSPHLKLLFTLRYKQQQLLDKTRTDEDIHDYSYKFEIVNYKTLFIIQSKVEPKESEFCRTGNMCNMHIHLTKVGPSNCSSLMYEVVADQTAWAVCGRTAGRKI